MDIEKLMLPIAEFTEYGEVCFAHLSENGERKETLREHTELCQKYWKEIVKRKKIDEIFQEFENVYLEELSKESRNLFELMTVNIVSVHDLGKINPNFQSDKMHHKWHEEVKPDPNIGSRHSILSSVFYLDYFLGKINEMWEAKQLIKKSEAEILKDFAYIYSYIISRHHGELKEFETYMASLTGKQMKGENLGKRAKSWYMMWKENILHVKELMAYEGEVWMRFYGDFVYFLPEDFVMNKRVKRPPDNPINALISFGNTLLYTKTIAAIYQTHLDQRISFLHEPSEGRFSLSLDLSEVFKPVIVFKTIFDLVNNRRLQVEKHFDKQVNYCVLNEEGRKIFIESFEERLESVFMHPKLKRKVSYRTALKLDCYKLIKNILEEKEFVSFSLKEGM